MAFPNVTIPGIPPAGDCCLWQLHKKAEGERRVKWGTTYTCDTGKTHRGDTRVVLTLSTAGPPCDQDPDLIPDGSRLEAKGNTIQRVTDRFSHFFGRFIISDPAGTILFRGIVELIDRIGTHHEPFGGEECNEEGHVEGWLVGRGSSALPNHTIRALIVARASLPVEDGSAPVFASIDGALIKCP
ncbi:MAG: hypothetical protein ACRDJG_02650 [Actinomycetota bacterium]